MSSGLTAERWLALWARLELDEPSGEALDPPGEALEQLLSRLGEKHRSYHDATHVADCLERLDESCEPVADDPRLELALWYHDGIYDPYSSENEQKSADWAVEVLKQAGASRDTYEEVTRLIMATLHQALPTTPAEQLMVDIDLSILGREVERYDLFEEQIRREYRWVPKPLFRRRRAELLQAFLERPQIFSSEEFVERFEQRARENLQRAIARLRA